MSATHWLAWPLIALIYVYRYTVRPLLHGSCRFYPTCSHYAEGALREHGIVRGSIFAVKRILKCHPWHEGGVDPVPTREQWHTQEQDR